MNARQTKFVEHYLKTGNGTQAAVEAGYSAKTAHVIACNLLKNVNVSRAIADAQAKAMTAGIVSLEEAMKIVSDIARKSKNEFARLQAVGVLERLGGWGTAQGGDVTLRVVYGDRGDAAPVVGQSVLPPKRLVVEQSDPPPKKTVDEQSVHPPEPTPTPEPTPEPTPPKKKALAKLYTN